MERTTLSTPLPTPRASPTRTSPRRYSPPSTPDLTPAVSLAEPLSRPPAHVQPPVVTERETDEEEEEDEFPSYEGLRRRMSRFKILITIYVNLRSPCSVKLITTFGDDTNRLPSPIYVFSCFLQVLKGQSGNIHHVPHPAIFFSDDPLIYYHHPSPTSRSFPDPPRTMCPKYASLRLSPHILRHMGRYQYVPWWTR